MGVMKWPYALGNFEEISSEARVVRVTLQCLERTGRAILHVVHSLVRGRCMKVCVCVCVCMQRMRV